MNLVLFPWITFIISLFIFSLRNKIFKTKSSKNIIALIVVFSFLYALFIHNRIYYMRRILILDDPISLYINDYYYFNNRIPSLNEIENIEGFDSLIKPYLLQLYDIKYSFKCETNFEDSTYSFVFYSWGFDKDDDNL